MGKTISLVALLSLLGVAFGAFLYTTVEGTNVLNENLTRRRPAQRIRGLRQDKEVAKTKAEDKTTKHRPNLPGVFQRPRVTFKTLGLNVATTKASSKSEQRLPEQDQALYIGVDNIKSGGNQKRGGLSSAKKENDRNGVGKNKEMILENGMEHFKEVEVEIYRREVPSFSIQFTVENSSSRSAPNLADYNELTDVSEGYLDNFFRSVFEDVQVRHEGTVLFLMVSEDDPYTVDFRMTLEFIIPGEVPTINFLIDRLQDGLERDTSKAFFIADLNSMSETNPFAGTVSFQVVSRPPVSVAEISRGGGKQAQDDSIEQVGKSNVLVSLLAGMGCVVIVGAGLMWRKKKLDMSAVSESNQIFSLFDKTKKKKTPDSNTSGIYGADEETMNYLNSIRKRYRDHDNGETSSCNSNDRNIAAVEQTEFDDEGEDSM
jgi:hypothetical protein